MPPERNGPRQQGQPPPPAEVHPAGTDGNLGSLEPHLELSAQHWRQTPERIRFRFGDSDSVPIRCQAQ